MQACMDSCTTLRTISSSLDFPKYPCLSWLPYVGATPPVIWLQYIVKSEPIVLYGTVDDRDKKKKIVHFSHIMCTVAVPYGTGQFFSNLKFDLSFFNKNIF